ncbi:hypothetical protein [Roseiflexus castenholzii]|uniref:hypothetical protein n=1 Tax=Roseiflexus castenholzii TaxID=120962 RepID=UPI003C7C86DC
MRLFVLLVIILTPFALSSSPVVESEDMTFATYLPLINVPDTRVLWGYDLRVSRGAQAESLLPTLPATWARAGDLVWGAIETQRGVYDWEAAAGLEANIRRLRAAGVEPIVLVQIAPAWARRLPDRACSPVAPDAYADLARFAAAVAARYRSGDLAVRYWQFWNEPDFTPAVADTKGIGCWNTGVAPWYGGDAYGAALRVFANAVRSVNPGAQIIGGNFAHFWPDDRQTLGFLRGMIEGSGLACDMIGFSGYTRWGSAERMTLKAQSLRRTLAAYGLAWMPLAAVEVADVCPEGQPCPPDYHQAQANYAARIYALAIALNLRGILWYTLLEQGAGFQHSHLADVGSSGVTPRPAFYAYRNAALLLQGATYAGPPLNDVRFDQEGVPHMLRFIARDGAPLYVFWRPTAQDEAGWGLVTSSGRRATCISHLERPTPLTVDCSDQDGDGLIRFTVSDAPIYIRLAP